MADLTQPNSGPARLRELLAGDRLVVAPGAYDALSARLVEQAGFDAVYLTGYGATASASSCSASMKITSAPASR
jgi:2-methylisocitrate lyase-like PEP mutase family enzyme